jgi:hypothetical protein
MLTDKQKQLILTLWLYWIGFLTLLIIVRLTNYLLDTNGYYAYIYAKPDASIWESSPPLILKIILPMILILAFGIERHVYIRKHRQDGDRIKALPIVTFIIFRFLARAYFLKLYDQQQITFNNIELYELGIYILCMLADITFIILYFVYTNRQTEALERSQNQVSPGITS